MARLPLDGDDWWCKPYLGEDWRLRRAYAPDTRDVHAWLPARVPGSVAHDAYRAGALPDPRVDRNSLACEWVAARTWVYRRQVHLDDHRGARVAVHFEGIDHSADVYWDGALLGHHEGAFCPARFALREDQAGAGPHLLAVVVHPAPDSQPQVGRSGLVTALKSRMTYGWDFCPRLVHLGIWDSVRVEAAGPVRLDDLWVRARPSPDRRSAAVACELTVDSAAPGRGAIDAAVRLDGSTVATATVATGLEAGTQVLPLDLCVEDPQLWWPAGYGAQPLYELRVRVRSHAGDDERRTTFGIRDVQLVANDGAPPDARGYTFRVNGRRVYVQGWNWVPTDVHHGAADPERTAHLVGLAARAGVNLLRVWGGGLIEKADFYEACDRAGIMVWQEFPLSSSHMDSRPCDDPDVVAAMAAQAARIVPRRRNHPSLVLWCGGNELDDAAGRPADDSEPVLGAFRAVVERLDPDRAWLPTSPTGPHATLSPVARDPDGQHDVHGPWEHQGLVAHNTLYDSSTHLLHSEFGVEGLTNLSTLEAFVSPEHRWPPDRSNPVWSHRGDWWINTQLLHEIFGPIDDLATLVRASQLLQAEGLRYAIEANRRRQWRSSGSIPWQLGEPFPNAFCTSAVDYCGRPKAAYYAVAAAYAALQLSAKTPTQAWEGRDAFEAEVWVASATEAVDGGRLEASLVDVTGSVHEHSAWPVRAPAGAATPLGSVHWPLPRAPGDLFWLDLRLLGRDGHTRTGARYVHSTATGLRPLLRLPATTLTVGSAEAGQRLCIRNAGPHVALGVTARDARPACAQGYAWFDAGHLTLLPGEERALDLGWHGAPAAQRRVAVGAWNAPEVHVG